MQRATLHVVHWTRDRLFTVRLEHRRQRKYFGVTVGKCTPTRDKRTSGGTPCFFDNIFSWLGSSNVWLPLPWTVIIQQSTKQTLVKLLHVSISIWKHCCVQYKSIRDARVQNEVENLHPPLAASSTHGILDLRWSNLSTPPIRLVYWTTGDGHTTVVSVPSFWRRLISDVTAGSKAVLRGLQHVQL